MNYRVFGLLPDVGKLIDNHCSIRCVLVQNSNVFQLENPWWPPMLMHSLWYRHVQTKFNFRLDVD